MTTAIIPLSIIFALALFYAGRTYTVNQNLRRKLNRKEYALGLLTARIEYIQNLAGDADRSFIIAESNGPTPHATVYLRIDTRAAGAPTHLNIPLRTFSDPDQDFNRLEAEELRDHLNER